MKLFILTIIFIIVFYHSASAEYLYGIDRTVVNQIDWNTKIESNEYRSRILLDIVAYDRLCGDLGETAP